MNFVSKIGKFKIPDLAAYGLVFLLFFSIGIMGGKVIGKNKLFKIFQDRGISIKSEAKLSSDQHNYLVIGVDQIKSSNPNLESIWLLISFPGKSSLTLIPVYPTVEGGIPLADSTLAELFSISAEGIPGTGFSDHLREQIRWDNYILIDMAGYAAVFEFLDQGKPDFEVTSTLTSLPPVWQDPVGALQAQTQLMNAACTQASNLPGKINTIEFIQNIQPHFHTDINWEEIIQQWSFEQQDSFQINCEFPTLVLEIQ